MKRVAVVLMIAAGSATAEPFVDAPSDSNSGLQSSATNASAIYAVDEDRDGRADRLLILEHSDSLV